MSAPRGVLGMLPAQVPMDRLRRRLGGGLAVVTGGSRGVGERVVHRLAAAGARVILLARSEEQLRRVVDDVALHGGSAAYVVCDLRDAAAATEAARTVLRTHGPVQVLVSNAGHSIRRDLRDYTERFHDVARLAGVNFLGPVAFALPILHAMMTQGGGHVISVGSASMTMPGPGWSAYTATKAGFDSWLRSVSPELRRSGVTTTSIHLPLTRTEMSAPTYSRSSVPALSADEASTWVARAVVERRRVIAPWWARAGATLTTAFPGAADRVAAAVWERAS